MKERKKNHSPRPAGSRRRPSQSHSAAPPIPGQVWCPPAPAPGPVGEKIPIDLDAVQVGDVWGTVSLYVETGRPGFAELPATADEAIRMALDDWLAPANCDLQQAAGLPAASALRFAETLRSELPADLGVCASEFELVVVAQLAEASKWYPDGYLGEGILAEVPAPFFLSLSNSSWAVVHYSLGKTILDLLKNRGFRFVAATGQLGCFARPLAKVGAAAAAN